MRIPFAPKILSWQDCGKSPQKLKGSASLLAAFLAVIFTSIGMGTIHLTLIHMRLVSHKKDAVRLDLAAENGLKDSYSHTTQLLRKVKLPLALTDQEMTSLETNIQQQGVRTVEILLDEELPIHHEGQFQDQSWQSQVSFSLKEYNPYEGYFRAVYGADISTAGQVTNVTPQRESELRAILELQIGRIPLALFQILIDKKAILREDFNYPEFNNGCEIIP